MENEIKKDKKPTTKSGKGGRDLFSLTHFSLLDVEVVSAVLLLFVIVVPMSISSRASLGDGDGGCKHCIHR